MSEVKVRLSLELPGGTMLSKQECLRNPLGKKKKDCYNYFHIEIDDKRSRKKEVINVAVRKCKTVKQNIKLSKEAYDFMTSSDCPNPQLKKKWNKFSINQKLQYHCSQIAEVLGAISFSFEVLDD